MADQQQQQQEPTPAQMLGEIQRLQGELLAAQNRARPRMKWPEWTGTPELLPVWKTQVLAKIRNDVGNLPDAEGVIMTIQQLLPANQQARTAGWLTRESNRALEPGETRWDSTRFLAHVMERCGDPEAANVALRRLTLFRQGDYQYFREFLQEFEVLQVRAEGTQIWPDAVKVNYLQQTLAKELLDRLVSVPNQPTDVYAQWVNLVADIAGRLEALPDREQARRSAPALQKSYFLGETNRPSGPNAQYGGQHGSVQSGGHLVDADGDIAMQVSRLIAAFGRGNSNNNRPRGRGGQGRGRGGGKPRAPWRPHDEFRRLLQRGACTRCTQIGHQATDCPTYRSALRPSQQVPVNALTDARVVELDDMGQEMLEAEN
jgi:hypothetical protein